MEFLLLALFELEIFGRGSRVDWKRSALKKGESCRV